MPWSYRHAKREWRSFLDDVREIACTPSDNVAYTMTEGVFRAFRGRLTPQQALDFAQDLPALPRALFVQNWQLADPVPWADPATILAEVKALRKNHNFAPDNAVEAVSFALHRAVRPDILRRALAKIGPEAQAFWQLSGYSDKDLSPGFG
ncbi:DUF2267 domain-containing protein [Primorskyibacter sp. 2E233]|uniref:DUF2267 domain-containing protein n=1 Tax=Primorskyibacter sp. 2E233 TaxID=3413431 RepID=UPI003BF1687E